MHENLEHMPPANVSGWRKFKVLCQQASPPNDSQYTFGVCWDTYGSTLRFVFDVRGGHCTPLGERLPRVRAHPYPTKVGAILFARLHGVSLRLNDSLTDPATAS